VEARLRGRTGALLGIIGIAVVVVGAGTIAWAAGSAGAVTVPHFIEETSAAGVSQTYDGPLPYFAGGGVAVFDCDGDGRPELFVAGGTHPAGLFHNDSAVGGALRFHPVHDSTTDLTSVTGAYPLDIDGDGVTDLAVLRIGGNVLLRGLGGCRFEAANDRWKVDGGTAATMGFAATWEGTATLPTLAFGNYVDPASNDPHATCYPNELVRPATNGLAYDPALELRPGYCALSMLFSDWSRSGRRDLRISNDAHYYSDGEEQLWRMEPDVAPRLYTAAEGWTTVNVEGMGIASYDVTGDGYPEVFLTSQGSNRLQTLTGGPSQPTYGDIGLKRGVLADRPFTGGDPLPSTAWHPEFEDVNNDGRIDLFISKGNVRHEEGFAMRDPSNLLLGQADGTFAERADAAGILNYDLGRGAAVADFNLDGLPDIVEVNLGSPVRLWRNVGSGSATAPAAMGHWLGVRLSEPGGNRDAIGSWLEVQTGDTVQRREVVVGGGHGGGQLGWVHVGLGAATTPRVRVTWPDGTVGPWIDVHPDGFVVVDRASGTAQPWIPSVAP
jgi:hypothetical protein